MARTLFDAQTLTPEDKSRLRTLLVRVRVVMEDQQWHTLAELAAACGGSEASCSARLRELRSLGNSIDRERVSGGLWKYRMNFPF